MAGAGGAVAPADKKVTFTGTPFGGGASTWSGTTIAAASPSGHNGLLSVTFAAPSVFGGGSTLSWSDFFKGAKAVCTISNNINSTVITLPSCNDGSIDVFPTVTTTYTFTDVKNEGNADPVTASFEVVVPTEANLTATWMSNMGPGDDDPGVLYNGKASGPPSLLQTDATSDTNCKVGGTADHFHATMTLVDATHISGTYEGIACTSDMGTFSLTKQ